MADHTPESRPPAADLVPEDTSLGLVRDKTSLLEQNSHPQPLPPLPSENDSGTGDAAPTPQSRPLKPADSFVDTTSIDGSSANLSRIDPITEELVLEHLQDVESSFIPPISPIQTHNPEGIDDTYLFDKTSTIPAKSATAGTATTKAAAADMPSMLDRSEATPLSPVAEVAQAEEDLVASVTASVAAAAAAATAAATAPTPAPARGTAGSERELYPGVTTPPATSTRKVKTPPLLTAAQTNSSFDISPSPTAAAHARSMSRALSRTNSKKGHAPASTSTAASRHDEQEAPVGTDPPSDSLLDLSADATTLRHQESEQTLRKSSTDADTSTPGQSLKVGKRPKYLKSRNASQRSSASSFASQNEHDDNDSDATVGLGADYALQTGGAIPTLGTRSMSNNILSRSVSMGSVASGFDDYEDTAQTPRAEDDDEHHHHHHHLSIPDALSTILETPKAQSGPLAAPTDTVIARHVRNVQVPESLAKEYKTQRGLKTPRPKASQDMTFGTERKTKNMTLKEQSTTLDRLSKENFDLKLKVVFLNEKLGQLSEEGIKDMVKENVDLKTSLAIAQRDNKSLRRRCKQMEKQLKEADERPATTTRSFGSDDDSDDGEREEELIYMRERIEEYTTEIEKLKNDNLSKEMERRRLADSIQSMGTTRSGEPGAQEETDVWKDLLEQETARREHVDDENRRLRDELFHIKQEGLGGLQHHTVGMYNSGKKGGARASSPSRPLTGDSENDTATAGSATLVDELQRDRERLNHEVAELRREINAQASMLTSRNREKDRLYQEIEDLKLSQRRGGGPAPSTVDTILERSASRAGHDRSPSGVSGPMTVLEDAEREDYENKQADMRDKINELKFQNQNLQQELEACMADFEVVVDDKRQLEDHCAGLQAELDAAENDLLILQKERDEALQEQEAIGVEFERLRQEAQEEIDSLEESEDRLREEIKALDGDLKEKNEDLNALQHKMREMSEAINQIEDKMDLTNQQNDKLKHELSECNQEVEGLEARLRDANDKTQRLNVQQENFQVEIGFLRDEQENHIVKIGNLEASLDAAQQSVHDEKERIKELERRLASERKQYQIVATQEKDEVQKFVNDLNKEAGNAKDEARRLRKMLTSKEVESTEWKERLHELESNLRVALGDLSGTRSSLLKSIEKLQRELENTVRELDSAKAGILEKDRLIKQRDSLLESHALESRKVRELLDKEQQGHRNTKHQFETFQKTHDHVSRTANTQEGRIVELESSRSQDRRKIATLESQFRDQLNERNSLLLVLWSRLSSICGSDWAHNNSLINGRALPSLESVATMLPGFSKNLIAAVKTIEGMLGDMSGRIKGVEKELWREYQALENQLDLRVKKVDRLESLVRNSIANGSITGGNDSRLARLEEAYRALKVENTTLRSAKDARIRSGYTNDPEGGSPSPHVPTGPRDRRRGFEDHRTSTMSSRSGGATPNDMSPQKNVGTGTGTGADAPAEMPPSTSRGSSSMGPSTAGAGMDNKWMFRLRDLESKLKVEREARQLDRSSARQRLAQQTEENRSLRAEVVRLKRSGGLGQDEDQDGRGPDEGGYDR